MTVGDGAKRATYGGNPVNSIWHKFNSRLKNIILKSRLMMAEENGEGRRLIWLSLAELSFLLCYVLIQSDRNILKWLLKQLWKVKIMNEVKPWLIKAYNLLGRNDVFNIDALGILITLHFFFLLYLALRKTEKPLKLSPSARCFIESMIVVTCLMVAYYVDDFIGMIFAFGCCFHMIPLLNLSGANENFGFLDCFEVFIIEVALALCKMYPKCAPFAVGLIFACLQLIKTYYVHGSKMQGSKENSEVENRDEQNTKRNCLIPIWSKREDGSR